MKLIFLKNNFFLKKVIFLYIELIVLISLISCKTVDSNAKPDLSAHVLKPIALITTNPPKKLKNVWPKILREIETRLRNMPYLGKVVGYKDQEKKISRNSKIKSELRTYINILSLTGISDKEIALKLQETLEIEYFLFLDFLSFPCTLECSSNQQWLIRLKLIESPSGETIFWVRKKYEIPESIKDLVHYEELATKVSLEVINAFAKGFVIPWHIWRYIHLNPSNGKLKKIS